MQQEEWLARRWTLLACGVSAGRGLGSTEAHLPLCPPSHCQTSGRQRKPGPLISAEEGKAPGPGMLSPSPAHGAA